MRYIAGIDIGGTKCAVSIGVLREEAFVCDILYKERFPTPKEPRQAVELLVATLQRMAAAHREVTLSAIGVSCGSPLDSARGLVQCPPNLPNWDNIAVTAPFEQVFGVPAALQNDANACADSTPGRMIWRGRSVMCAWRRMAPKGTKRRDPLKDSAAAAGLRAAQCRLSENGRQKESRQEFCVQGRMSRLLAMLIDTLNPERIVIGSIFLRQEAVLRKPMEEVIAREALSCTRRVCEIVPAGLGEQLGDYAALSVAGNLLRQHDKADADGLR